MKKLPTVDIKGKEYVLVVHRISAFNELYPSGSITTELVSEYNDNLIVVKATVIPDTKNLDRRFTGYSQAVVGKGFINTTSALENAETSAVGRALAMMGIGIIDDVASGNEIDKSNTVYGSVQKQTAKRVIDNARQGKPTNIKDFEEAFTDPDTGEVVYDSKYHEMNDAKKAHNREKRASKKSPVYADGVYSMTLEAVQKETDKEKLLKIKEKLQSNKVLSSDQIKQLTKIIETKYAEI